MKFNWAYRRHVVGDRFYPEMLPNLGFTFKCKLEIVKFSLMNATPHDMHGVISSPPVELGVMDYCM